MANLFSQNPLATLEQLEETPSSRDGIPSHLEEDLRNYGGELIQSAGILLKLPQVAMATAQILFQRFFYMDSLRHFGILEIGMGALFLASKIEESRVRIEYVITVFDFLSRRAKRKPTDSLLDLSSKHACDLEKRLIASEMMILEKLGFNVHVQLPYNILVNYLGILGLEDDASVPSRAWNYLNDGLRTTVYVTHPPHAIAAAAIWMACRDALIKLPVSPGAEWWLLFDVRLEDLEIIGAHTRRLYHHRLDRAHLPLFKEDLLEWQKRHDTAIP